MSSKRNSYEQMTFKNLVNICKADQNAIHVHLRGEILTRLYYGYSRHKTKAALIDFMLEAEAKHGVN